MKLERRTAVVGIVCLICLGLGAASVNAGKGGGKKKFKTTVESDRLQPGEHEFVTFEVPDGLRKLEFKLKGKSRFGNALISRPSYSTFFLVGHQKTVEYDPEPGTWEVLFAQPAGGKACVLKLKLKGK